MGILEYFKDWMSNNEERKKFRESWINGKLASFRWDDNIDQYHADVAYEIYKLSQRVEELEKSIK